ncbi:VacJ family lipoprotein [Fundidesulfovibrio butyratiphilus]
MPRALKTAALALALVLLVPCVRVQAAETATDTARAASDDNAATPQTPVQAAPEAVASQAADDDYVAPRPSVADPLEKFNRFWFGFNDVFYTRLGTPISKVYSFAVPAYLRDRIHCAYQNFLFPVRFLNAILQLRPDKASRELGRFIINTTFGIGGLYDLAATKPDMFVQKLDFGQTLGYWGAGHGFYIVLPFIGPSSLRDAFGLAGDTAMQPLTYVDVPVLLTATINVGARVNRLPEMLELYQEFKRSAIEPYTAARDAYVQLREQDVREAQVVTKKPKKLERQMDE